MNVKKNLNKFHIDAYKKKILLLFRSVPALVLNYYIVKCCQSYFSPHVSKFIGVLFTKVSFFFLRKSRFSLLLLVHRPGSQFFEIVWLCPMDVNIFIFVFWTFQKCEAKAQLKNKKSLSFHRPKILSVFLFKGCNGKTYVYKLPSVVAWNCFTAN